MIFPSYLWSKKFLEVEGESQHTVTICLQNKVWDPDELPLPSYILLKGLLLVAG